MSNASFVLGIVFGALTVALGIIILFNPVATVAAITVLISILMVITGIGNIFFYFNTREFKGAIYYLIEGLISLVIGMLILSSEDALKNFIPLLIAFWLILKGVSIIISSIDMKKRGYASWKYMLTGGIAAIIAGFTITAFPAIMSVYISVIIGAAFAAIGAAMIVILFRLRKLSGY